MKLSVWAAIAGLGLSVLASARAAIPYPKVLQPAVRAGVVVVRSFPAASGLKGWVLSQGGRYSIVYTTPDSRTLVAGALLDESGTNLTAAHEARYVPQPDWGAAFGRLERSRFVPEGAARPQGTLYVFVDPNCPFCHLTWRALQPYEAAGLQVRWILVGTLGPTSAPKAIEVLAAADRTAAFRRMEASHGKPWTASPAASADAHPAQVQELQQNNALMEMFGIGGTPGLVWRDRQGRVQVRSGMPRLSELPAITGLPEQRSADPALDKFR